MILASLLLLAAQEPKLPPAEPPPPPGDQTLLDVMAPVDAMLAAIGRRDGAAILVQARPEGGTMVSVEAPGVAGTLRRLNWYDFAARLRPGPERHEERLTDPAVEIDGDIALVWSPYLFLIDGKVDHCGVDHFDLVREGGRWKVLNLTWSERRTGCAS